ncbi:MAG: hypothetical protein WKF30_19170 [Pyrinomonadaceae bacterium]
MRVRLIEANPRVRENYGRIAIERGPLVYCLEAPPGEKLSPFDVSLLVDENPADDFTPEFRPELLGGVTVIRAAAVAAAAPHAQEPLYRELNRRDQTTGKQIEVMFIPYYSWANRGPSEMEVWLPWRRKGK